MALLACLFHATIDKDMKGDDGFSSLRAIGSFRHQ